MYYYWIAVAILLLVAMLSDTGVWSPFQSDQVREICTHMTKAERRSAVKQGALWGILLGWVPGTVGLILGIVVFQSALIGVTICLVALPLMALVLYKKWFPGLVRSQRNFLASTEWAKSQGMRPDDIRLYKWSK